MQKKIVLYISAFLGLIILFFAGYFITGLFVKPKTLTISKAPEITTDQVKKLMPQDVTITNFSDHIEIAFTTAEPSLAYAFITYDPAITFTKVLSSLKTPGASGAEQANVKSLWVKEVNTNPAEEHKIIVPLTDLDANYDKAYMYLLIKWNKFYIPYGEQTSLASGPLTAWLLNLGK